MARPPPPASNDLAEKYLGPKIPRSKGFAIALLANYSVFSPEITMPKINLSGMTVEALMDLRKRVDEALHKRRAELEKELRAFAVGRRVVRGGASALKGNKEPPKYPAPSGGNRAGRGAATPWRVS